MRSTDFGPYQAADGHFRFEQILSDLSARFIHLPSRNLDNEIEHALKNVLAFFQVDRCGLLRLLPDKKAWEITHAAYSAYGQPVPIGTKLPLSMHPWAYEKLAIKGEVISFSNVSEMPDEAYIDRQTWLDWGIRSNLVIPVLKNRSMVHVIVINAMQKERTWPEEFIPRLQLLGEIIVSAIERSMADHALRENAARLSLAVDSAGAGLWELNYRTNIYWVSDQARLIFGYGPDDIIRQERFEESVHPDDRQGVRQAIDRTLNNVAPVDIEYRIVTEDGRLRWIAAKGQPHYDSNGELTRVLGIASDITTRKQMEAALKDQLNEIGNLKRQLEIENIYLREDLNIERGFKKIVGSSRELKSVLFAANQVAPTDTTVLILGETGTGKGMIANAIHQMSARKERPFITVNCSALPYNLIESELFGREKGAFTGAYVRQAGRFEVADGGTVFLDEIGEMPIEIQSKLLRVLQEGEFERLGSARTVDVDVRVIAATNRDLQQEVRAGRFREDLYYRLNVFPLELPPLRNRRDDIPVLVRHFTKKYADKMDKRIDRIPQATIDAFKNYDWPGNVRELEHVIERGVVVSVGNIFKLPCQLISPVNDHPNGEPLKDLATVERDYILKVLEKVAWKIEGPAGAASILNLPPSTLRSRIKKLEIHRPG